MISGALHTISSQLKAALSKLGEMDNRLRSLEKNDSTVIEPQMPFMPCKYIFFPVEITSLSTISSVVYGKILNPDFTVDTDYTFVSTISSLGTPTYATKVLEITVPRTSPRPIVGDIVRADYLGNVDSDSPVYGLFGSSDVWVQLTEALHAGGSAGGKICTWGTHVGTFTVAATTNALVVDPIQQHWGLKGERLRCRAMTNGNSIVYVAQSAGSPWQFVQLDDDLNAGSWQTASVYGGINGETSLLTVYAEFSVSGFVVPGQAFVGATYSPSRGRWTVSEASCRT